ncbi:hypothetical protein [Mycolicibacterium holsaticum]|nr:hypothetical protein [Mycolicibacterium holsaticum]
MSKIDTGDTMGGYGGLSHVCVGVMKNLKGPRAQYVLASAIVAHVVPL